MTAREYLGQYRQLRMEIDRMIDDATRMYARAERITTRLTGMPRGGAGSWTDIIDRIIDRGEDINARELVLKEMEDNVIRAINAIPYSNQRQCLWRRYVMCESWPKVARTMGYSVDGIYYLHRRALKNIKLDSTLQ